VTTNVAGSLYFALFLMVTHCEPDRGEACDVLAEQINKSYELIDFSAAPIRMFQPNIIPQGALSAAAAHRLKLLMRYDDLHCDRIGR